MTIATATLPTMSQAYRGFELTEQELELVRLEREKASRFARCLQQRHGETKGQRGKCQKYP